MDGVVAWRAWAAFRWREAMVWAGIPAVGLFAGGRPELGELVVFGVATAAFALHILLLNDWGGLVRNPAEVTRLAPARLEPRGLLTAAAATAAVSLGVFALMGWRPLALASCGVLLNLAYSHPRVHLKAVPAAAATLHLLMGAALFLLGWLTTSAIDGEAATLAGFFAGVFAAGHFVHECIDAHEDGSGGVRTTAVRVGVRPTLVMGWLTFVTAHGALVAVALAGAVTSWLAALLTLPIAAHLSMASRLKDPTSARRYRFAYRTLFGCATIAIAGVRLFS